MNGTSSFFSLRIVVGSLNRRSCGNTSSNFGLLRSSDSTLSFFVDSLTITLTLLSI